MFEIADPRFSARADAHINLSNAQCRDASADKVTLSMIDASCRFDKHFDEYVANFDSYIVAQRPESENAPRP